MFDEYIFSFPTHISSIDTTTARGMRRYPDGISAKTIAPVVEN
jgi:hypothetical protein